MVYRHGYSKHIGSLRRLRSLKLSDQHTVVSPHITQLNPPRPCFSSVCLQLLLLLPPSSSLLITLHRIVSLSHCFVIIPLRHVYLFIYFFALNLAVHRVLKPPKSICPTPLGPSVTTVTPSVPFDLFALPSLASAGPGAAMLEHMSRRSRSLLSLTLTTLALALSILALCTSYWCEGTHKVVKPLCLSPVKMKNCGQNNSEPYTTGTRHTLVPAWFSARYQILNSIYVLFPPVFCGTEQI